MISLHHPRHHAREPRLHADDIITSKLTRGGQTILNTYDTLDRLTLHTVPQPSPATAIQTATAYNLAGRTLTVSDNAAQDWPWSSASARMCKQGGHSRRTHSSSGSRSVCAANSPSKTPAPNRSQDGGLG